MAYKFLLLVAPSFLIEDDLEDTVFSDVAHNIYENEDHEMLVVEGHHPNFRDNCIEDPVTELLLFRDTKGVLYLYEHAMSKQDLVNAFG
jgi:hypothetical protein